MYLVSACLAGYNCRYDAKNCLDEEILELVNNGKALPLCPEQLGGLPTPRISGELRPCDGEKVKVFGKNGEDLTEYYVRGANHTLAMCLAIGVRKAILKSRSPSCGCGVVYDGSFTGRLVPGDGVTTALLKRHGIEVRPDMIVQAT